MKNLFSRRICIILFTLLFSLNISWSQTPNRGGGRLNSSYETTSVPARVIQAPQAGETILFLGNFNFDLDVDATSFRDFLTGRGYLITEVATSPSDITLSYLNQYDAIVLYDLSGSVSAGEADIFYDYVVNYSGNLLLLGQLIGFPSADRNMIGDKFGIHFNDDLFCDPESYYAYDGGCSESAGDPDNGVEYVRLVNFANHPVTNNVSSFLLNWGQSLNIFGSAQSIAYGSSSSWGDQDAIYDWEDDCYDGWYVNTDDYWEPHGNLVGIAAFESGGKVVGIGDQDMLWNFWFYGGQETLFGNIFSWFFPAQTIDITITTSPVGLQISVDDISYTSPQIFDWVPGSVHEIEVSSPQSTGEGIRYVYDHWSDGLGQTHDITTPSESAIYTAYFDTEYYLTMEADPPEGGSVTPASGWRAAGSSVEIEADPNNSYYFSGWAGSGDGSYSGTSNPADITMNGPVTQTAHFSTVPEITINTSPTGREIIIDEESYIAPRIFQWDPGSIHSIGVSSPQSGEEGSRYVYDHWSDGLSQTHDITTPSESATYTVYFNTEYYLTMEVDVTEGGTVTPSSSWQTEGVDIEIESFPNSGYSFAGWTGSGDGSYSGTSNPVSITMNDQITQIAHFLVNNVASKFDEIPKNYALHQNYPNPFNPDTKIEFVIPKASNVRLEIYSTNGQKREVLLNQFMTAGIHKIQFEGQNFPSGIYFYRIQAGEFQDVKKMILLR